MPKRSRSLSPLWLSFSESPESTQHHSDSSSLSRVAKAQRITAGHPNEPEKRFIVLGSTSSAPSSPYASADLSPRWRSDALTMRCDLPPHEPLDLPSLEAFDQHYATEHAHRCLACDANLPSAWLLELHQTEEHDPLIAAKREKGERTFKCFVPTCERVCSSHAKRRMHLIDKHIYPPRYIFDVVTVGLKGRTSLLRGSGGKGVSGSSSRGNAGSSRAGLGRGRAGFWRSNGTGSSTGVEKSTPAVDLDLSSEKGKTKAKISESVDDSKESEADDEGETDDDDEAEEEEEEEGMTGESSSETSEHNAATTTTAASTPGTLAGSASPAAGGKSRTAKTGNGSGTTTTTTNTTTTADKDKDEDKDSLETLTRGVQGLRFVPLSVRMQQQQQKSKGGAGKGKAVKKAVSSK